MSEATVEPVEPEAPVVDTETVAEPSEEPTVAPVSPWVEPEAEPVEEAPVVVEESQEVPANAYEEQALAEEAEVVTREVKDNETGWTAQSNHGVLLPHEVPSQDYKAIEANPDERILATDPEFLSSPAENEKSDFSKEDSF